MSSKSLTEAEKMRMVPGIIFADGPTGRRARVAGTGIEVFEVIKALRSVGEDRLALTRAFDWLAPEQLQAAFDYYAAFPGEIDTRLTRDAEITPEYIREKYPLKRGSQARTRLR